MEHLFEFQIDFETISSASLVLEDQRPQKNESSELAKSQIKKIYQCPVPSCGKKFRYKSELTRHGVIHKGDRPYSCTHGDCKKAFKRSDALLNHMRTHAEVLPHACSISGCDKKFASKAALRYHKFTHDGNLSYKCEFPEDNMSIFNASQLQHHQGTCISNFGSGSSKGNEEENASQDSNSNFSKVALDASNHIQWETKSQSCEKNCSDQDAQERLEKLLMHLLNENRILRKQLTETTKETNLSEQKYESPIKSDYQSQIQSTEEFSGFFDNDEMRFLEFLKERESDSF